MKHNPPDAEVLPDANALLYGGMILAFFFVCFCIAMTGERPDVAYAGGASQGSSDGARAGRMSGYDAAFKAAESKTYNESLDAAVASGRFRKDFDLGFFALCA